jgi:hypothetical protein
MSTDVREFGSRRTNSGVALSSRVTRRFDQDLRQERWSWLPVSCILNSEF